MRRNSSSGNLPQVAKRKLRRRSSVLFDNLDLQSNSELCTTRRLSSSLDVHLPAKMEQYECFIEPADLEEAIRSNTFAPEFADTIQVSF